MHNINKVSECNILRHNTSHDETMLKIAPFYEGKDLSISATNETDNTPRLFMKRYPLYTIFQTSCELDNAIAIL
ncbi:hypothetical protein KM92DES2_11540 [uncultured Desulfovibrio sp.]|uniref:Uncharacterized protein n=1 Tax=uncultured Desulfovibrio sp. TaxID=167968 RepID=A0A212JQD6_9BACT|nr:hypothetical protein KM92DES2_11540 [uncultured Desulfovibrio sp.]